MNDKTEKVSEKEIIAGWEKTAKEYKSGELLPAEKAAFARMRGENEALQIAAL